MSVGGFSAALGVVEVAIAILIAAPALAPGVRPRQRPGGRNVPDDLELPRNRAGRLGAECRRLPRPLGAPGAVPHQGPGPARDFAPVARRGLESEPASPTLAGRSAGSSEHVAGWGRAFFVARKFDR